MKRYDYMSPEWAAEVKKQLQADLPAEKMKFITTSSASARPPGSSMWATRPFTPPS